VRDLAVIEAELQEISAIQDDTVKLERIVAWSAAHPHEVPLALRFLVGSSKGIEDWLQRHAQDQAN
jgi:hypothetical protein